MFIQIELSPSQSEVIAENHLAICGVKSAAAHSEGKIINLEFPTNCLDIDWHTLSQATLHINDDGTTLLYLCSSQGEDVEIEGVKWQKVTDFL